MGNDTRPQRSATMEYNHIQETNEHCAYDLHQILSQAHSTSVDEIQNMSQTKCHTGYHHGPSNAVSAHGLEQESTENQLLQETNTKHFNDKTEGANSIIHSKLCVDCRLTSFGWSLQTNFRITLDDTVAYTKGFISPSRTGGFFD